MPLGTFFFLGPLVVAFLCGIGMMFYYQLMVDEVQAKLPDNEHMRFAHASWNAFKVTRLHRQFYPGSRIGSVYRFLARLAVFCIATSLMIAFYFVFSNRPRQ